MNELSKDVVASAVMLGFALLLVFIAAHLVS